MTRTMHNCILIGFVVLWGIAMTVSITFAVVRSGKGKKEPPTVSGSQSFIFWETNSQPRWTYANRGLTNIVEIGFKKDGTVVWRLGPPYNRPPGSRCAIMEP